MKYSDAAIALLKEFEQGPDGGFAARPYPCPPGGEMTVGWGHVVRPSDRFTDPLTAERADGLLRRDLERFCTLMTGTIRVPVKQCMIDALLCFVFNVGIGKFLASTLLVKLNRGDYAGSADEFSRWNKARDKETGQMVELVGLTRRRRAERDLFLRDGA